MPSLQEIREFNSSFVRLAGEPEVIKQWGEEVEALPEPDEGLDTDLSSLLADTGDLEEIGPAPPEEAPDDAAPDFADLLGEDADEDADAELPHAEEFPEPVIESGIGEDADAAAVDAGETNEDDFDFSDFEALLSDEPLTEPAETEPGEPTPPGEEPALSGEEPSSFGEEPPSPVEELPPLSEEPPSLSEEPADEPSPDVDTEEPAVGEPLTADGRTEDGRTEDDLGGFEISDEDFSLDDETFSFDDESGDEPAVSEAPTEEDDIFGIPEDGEKIGDEEQPETAERVSADEDGDVSGLEADLGDLGPFEFTDEETEDEIPATSDELPSFEEPGVPGEDATPELDETEGDFGERAIADLESLDTGEIDEFSLGDFGAEFGVLGDEGLPTEEDLNPALSVPAAEPGVPTAAAAEFEISDGEFESLQATMSTLPLNLKLEIEQIITEAKGTTDQVEELVKRLAAGESPTDIGSFAGKILGKQIRIPRGYARRTGLEFEAEQQSFAYQFRENVLPILRLVAVFVVTLGVVALAGYQLVFRPLYGRSLYREGIALIGEDQYTLGNQTFERAREVWPSNQWFYTYAETFISERQYTLAGEKYEQLLFGMSEEERDYFNDLLQKRQYSAIVSVRELEKQGILDFATLESEVLGNYTRADQLLQLIIVRDVADYDAGLAIGDNYMLWAETDPARYEDARVAYARLMENRGQTDELLFRMLRYFVRTDNLQEVVTLKELFQQDERIDIEPDAYAEMAGYLIDNRLLEEVEEVLLRALDTDRFIPDIHYNLARYYRLINARGEEERALVWARRLLEESSPLTKKIRGMLVDTITRIGENYYDAERFLDAQETFGEAIEVYEEGLRRRVLGPDPMYGRAYAHLADIHYYIGRQYDDALRYLNAAEENGYDEPNLDYKQGFILYRNGQWDTALGEFREAAADPSGSTSALLWATGNTYYRRGNYFAAEAYYRELLERVELQRDNIRTLLVDEDAQHQSVVEYLIRVNNNLGVTLNQMSKGTGNPELFSTALIYLTQSIEYSENYRRDPYTLARSSAVDLAYLNQRDIIYPTPEYSLQIYNDLPEDLDDPLF